MEFSAYGTKHSVAVLGVLEVVEGAEGRPQAACGTPQVPHSRLRPPFGVVLLLRTARTASGPQPSATENFGPPKIDQKSVQNGPGGLGKCFRIDFLTYPIV